MSLSSYTSSRAPRIGVLGAAALVVAGLLTAPTAATAVPAPPRIMAALGDSITRAPLADGPTAGTGINSWSTGTTPSVESHRARLTALGGSPVTAYNVAVAGTTSSDLTRQAALAVGYRAEYVTILSGANNVCKATSVASLPAVDEFRTDVASALKTLATGVPSAEVLLLSVPSLQAVLDAGKSSRSAVSAWGTLGTCPIMLADPLSQAESAVQRRSAVETRIREMNAALATVCASYATCTYDGGAVYGNHPALADLSPVDYFHPSLSGQARIATITWAEVLDNHLFTDAPAPTQPTPEAPQPAPAPEPAAPQPPSSGSPSTARWTIDETSSKLAFAGSWRATRSTRDSGGSVSFSASKGSSFSLTFTGTRVSVVARRTPSSGISDVSIDGVPVGRIDGYAADTEYQSTVFASETLPLGEHTITVTVSGSRAAASTGHNLIVDALIVEVPQ
ncbi:hypothetical protein G5T42_02745 [Microbacterium sp. 4R-513]|uniref:GDSL-type esterase/lipase family protein n=1 Tax=Microbacterium sp. 4R-513 TaxID=2567934 RepID=UPI0013E0F23B|nr:GDSL-type esterase/lipase family protein [Microbacterium sp. 4R-513]QIG38529.1 hypothetical protein G5T42_02745 [Microbacterium sp. 4R-513]